MILSFPVAFFAPADASRKGSDEGRPAERTIYDALFALIAPNIERALREYDRGR